MSDGAVGNDGLWIAGGPTQQSHLTVLLCAEKDEYAQSYNKKNTKLITLFTKKKIWHNLFVKVQ